MSIKGLADWIGWGRKAGGGPGVSGHHLGYKTAGGRYAVTRGSVGRRHGTELRPLHLPSALGERGAVLPPAPLAGWGPKPHAI